MPTGVTVSFAPGGPNAADDAIVALVETLVRPGRDGRRHVGPGPRRPGPSTGGLGGERQTFRSRLSGSRCRGPRSRRAAGGHSGQGYPAPTMSPLTKFGLQIPSFTYGDSADVGPDGLFEQVVSIATTAETSGFDSVWVMDHLFQIPGIGQMDEPMFEAYTLLGGLAARTRRARLGAMVTGVTYRNPALLAKEVTTLDVLSGGRAVLGIGAAWFEAEHQGLGFAFPPLSERFDRLEEALVICRSMFTEEAPSFDGRYYRIDGAINRPRPVHEGGPPILIGGGGERRTLRLVAEQADACNLFGDAATIRHKLDVLARHCDEVGRDPATITKTRLGTLVIGASAPEAEGKADALEPARRHGRSHVRGHGDQRRSRCRRRTGGRPLRHRSRRPHLQHARRPEPGGRGPGRPDPHRGLRRPRRGRLRWSQRERARVPGARDGGPEATPPTVLLVEPDDCGRSTSSSTGRAMAMPSTGRWPRHRWAGPRGTRSW